MSAHDQAMGVGGTFFLHPSQRKPWMGAHPVLVEARGGADPMSQRRDMGHPGSFLRGDVGPALEIRNFFQGLKPIWGDILWHG